MNYPSLVLSQFAKTPIKITIYTDEITEDGAPAVALQIECLCNFQSKGQVKQSSSDGKTIHTIETSGKAYINGDIAEGMLEITSGEVEIFGTKKRIYKGTKARNPDGSVNYTLLELI